MLHKILIEPEHAISVLIAYLQSPPLNTNANVSRRAIGLNFGLISSNPYFAHASNKCLGESAHMHILAGPSLSGNVISTLHINLMCWLFIDCLD